MDCQVGFFILSRGKGKWQVMNKNRSVVLIAGLSSSRRLPLIAVLQRHGYETLEAGDGFEALQTAVVRDVDVLIAEDEMPGLTGRELIGVVRKHRAISHCLLISDTDQLSAGDTVLIRGTASFLVGPFEYERLLGRIREAVPELI
jgi:DNA-binding response OmpR family regulator